MAHSFLERLLNRAKENKEDFNLLLSRYGMERFLYRLSISLYSDQFILKGASLFLVWKGKSYRVTRDVDLLGSGDSDLKRFMDIFRGICTIDCPQDDGMTYLADSVKAEEIREDHEYGGMRITLSGLLNQAKIPLQIDIGFGDAVTPAPEIIQYPVLFDGPAPNIKAYSRYTMVAEKLEAMVRLGLANSRMKDFYDIWLLSKLFEFDGMILWQAITNTFTRRRMSLPAATPFALTASFYSDQQKQWQWAAFISKSRPDVPVGSLADVIAELSEFILPLIDAVRAKASFKASWISEKGWGSWP